MPPSVIIPLATTGFVVFFVVLWSLICYMLSHMSGWQKLAKLYPVTSAPQGSSVAIGYATLNSVEYKGTMFARVTNEGLHLSQLFLFAVGHVPVLIPWKAFRALPDEKVWWATMQRFQIEAGESTVEMGMQNARLAQTIQTWITGEAIPLRHTDS